MTEIILIGAAFFTSVLSGILGMAGGTLLLMIMAQFFPPMVLIPLHGVVQFGSNSSRALFSFKSIHQNIVVSFIFGAITGAIIGSQFLVSLPEGLSRIILGSFILLMTWMPEFKSVPRVPGKFFFVGLITCFLSLFIGATGPLQAPFFLREGLKKEALVATKAACQTAQHFLKVSAFMALGVSLSPYLFLLCGMLLAVFAGAFTGKLILHRTSEGVFLLFFKLVITILALRMLAVAVGF